jgi:uncharacterized protein
MAVETVTSPFHSGEREVQSRLGVREKVEEMGRRFIRSYMPTEHRQFYEGLPYLFLGSLDSKGRPWASVLVGRPGFIDTPDESILRISAKRIDGDPLNENLALDSSIGVLGIQYENRRRNRLTAKVSSVDPGCVALRVDQTFGNCPQYIQARSPRLLPGIDSVGEPRKKERLTVLNDRARDIIARADNFYIASHYSDGADDPNRGADVSHRGGRPGFVRIDDDHRLTFPDFTGNFHFNTIGNILMNPKAGLLFIDFETGDLLYLTCSAEIIWDGPEKKAFTGAERLVRFTVDEGLLVEDAMPVSWDFLDYSNSLDRTGSWDETAATIRARQSGSEFENYRVTRIKKESEVITSFYLAPENTEKIRCHTAGQFLPIEVNVPNRDEKVRRTYTISNAPNGRYYRLSIKRELPREPGLPKGLVSNYFHDHIQQGSIVRALSPRGQFVLEKESTRPVVLLSGGVGITPMISMLEQLAKDSDNCGCTRTVWFVHAARSGKERAFGEHVRKLAEDWPCLTTHIVLDTPDVDDVAGQTYDSVGRIDMELLKRLLPFDDYEFYICGPPPFMTSLYEGLKSFNIADDRIHYEFFSPGKTLRAEQPAATKSATGRPQSSESTEVRFAKSQLTASWTNAAGTILDLAEAEGLQPEFSCRSGFCGTCATRVESGAVVYSEPPLVEPDDGFALICCSRPASENGDTDPLILDL